MSLSLKLRALEYPLIGTKDLNLSGASTILPLLPHIFTLHVLIVVSAGWRGRSLIILHRHYPPSYFLVFLCNIYVPFPRQRNLSHDDLMVGGRKGPSKGH